MTPELASRFAQLALAHVRREFPNKLDHVLNGPDDVRGPSALHPVFFGSFDWHSCVHGYWLLATLLRTYPDIEEAERIRALFDEQLVEVKVAGEVAYLEQPMRAGFERPYGWAWLLMLAAELARHKTDDGKRWSAALKPLAVFFVARFTSFLPKATYATRVGTHFNSAFALALALEYADVMRDKRFARLLRGRAISWYTDDVDCQAWEPGGDDFLSSALMEAEAMRRALDPAPFQVWLARFLPHIEAREPSTLFKPAFVSDRSDGKIAHLDGLNLSRAWCWRSLANSWSDGDPRKGIALDAFVLHVSASLMHVDGDYMGEHWLATLITGNGGLFATHLPLVLRPKAGELGTLEGHIARANQHHGRVPESCEALVIFTGPNAHVTPTWYPSKLSDGRVVPTWNYIAVHAYGQVRFTDDTTFLREHLARLTARHEQARGSEWSTDDPPGEYVEQQLRAIVGVQILITRLEGKWKMSQNRPESDVTGVVEGLRLTGTPTDAMVADAVERRSR